ncbi:MAG: GIY-YIG nuclease [Elusimicrobia bacterium RIFOXYA1_FULL_47_7]|nr:MAG: GIY-YIG nuclease [Elusimicrobia bacterium RIFOXYA1_FULL_47_7]OGS10411.1 MAG: GIY-YIG nuclease [Elusimicrobia bacterium RIFOXYB1_FULL_48_9]OGS16716.1 MAG: GIY-YIG nuclease [Elusimicrobia bacterium RIFOXYA2_FULL_47_53]OGS26771.1 MAG: GIY-YIG nuclease [Elusimicrobia bacterium RIFOXYB12_FULL_50_12]OGS31675.1 MAG: GIY-YIG nuclease [Elusimicrobia bacterium RIFOXYB2_FULL_46_23]
MKEYYIYMLASNKNGTLYIGVTGNLQKRIYEHKNKMIYGFTKKYNIDKLVWFEKADEAITAIAREKQIKSWHRAWKIRLINKHNPNWMDLYYDLF